jgi:hypothetical protein
MGTKNT